MRFSFRHLLTGTLLALGCAALSGVVLPYLPTWMLLLHLASGIGGLIPVSMFLARHWWPRRTMLGHHRNARLGYVALACLVTLLLSGLALLRWTNVGPLQWLHLGATVLLAGDLCMHMAWRLRRRLRPGTSFRPEGRRMLPSRRIAAGIVVVALLGVGIWTARVIAGPLQPATTRIALAHASLGDNVLPSAQNCASCHTDLADQWRTSAHGQAATDPYYQALTAQFLQERGVDAVRYCATCHNPVGLMQGEIDMAAALRASAEGQASAYQARALGISLPISARAAEGVTCVLCHQAAATADQPTNGSLQLYAGDWVLPTNSVASLALRAAPEYHKRALLPAAIISAQMCGSCHNLSLPDNGMKLEPTYDEWLASPYPEQNKTCQSCHMPQQNGRMVNSGLPEPVSVHGGFPGAPSSLPALADNPTLLRSAATLDLQVASTPAELVATVTITNSGAGHYLPTGADDLRQVWLELTVRDTADGVLWQSGVMDAYGMLDAETVQFHKVLGDAQGNRIDLHRFWQTTQILEDTRLAPMEIRRIPYHIPIDRMTSEPLTLTVRLLYRDVSQSFAEFALEQPMPDLPTIEMVSTTLVLTTTSQ